MKLITIGRHPSNEAIIEDPKASRNHLQIIQDDDGNYTLFDLGSTNGTFVNGRKIAHKTEMPLDPMDIIRIGTTVLPWKTYFQEKKQSELIPEPEIDRGIIPRMDDTMPDKPKKKPAVNSEKSAQKPFPWRTVATVITTIVGLLMSILMLARLLGFNFLSR